MTRKEEMQFRPPFRDLLSDLAELRKRADDLRDETRRFDRRSSPHSRESAISPGPSGKKAGSRRMISPVGGLYNSN